ncbi:alpha-mannosidase IC [Delitschia confertaspora ATCC 74209]|uniref:alpha-1,2-Mannosidase n=1 Tax=Delitschia confertaspora ATCC 74209 TaxID=1513339 RepID=A0A9P4JJ52_9PLEO|nr:alpha-mannosidase IC [Delitschia confertaspora ATCC 74209]
MWLVRLRQDIVWSRVRFTTSSTRLQDSLPNRQPSLPHPPNPPLQPPLGRHFSWKNVPNQHPVESLTPLPKTPHTSLPPIQHKFDEETPLYSRLVRQRRQAAVKAAFSRAWTSYKERAWMKDELTPISGGYRTTFGGWAATLVDSLDTLWIMDMKNEFEEAVAAVMHIEFKPEGEVNMFETTIRYLGGFLSAYDLTDCKDSRLLEKAMELGDMIYASFNTPNRMPITHWDSILAAGGIEQSAPSMGLLAEMASFSLEFTRLSQLTGDMRYFDAATRVTAVLAEQQDQTKLPGLWPISIDIKAKNLTENNYFSIGGMADSAYEYLPKMFQLLRGSSSSSASQYREIYTSAMDAVIQHLLFRPMTPDNADILLPASAHAFNDSSVGRDNQTQHLSCFAGGMLMLGGRFFQNQTHVDVGRKVADGCIWLYANSPLGIMPEILSMASCPSFSPCDYSPPPTEPGGNGLPEFFTSVPDPKYILRPEAIESVFYAYRITGDEAYQDVAWDMFQAIDSHTRTQYGNAALGNVMEVSDPGKTDSMESFWMAETLKYFYLVFGAEEVGNLDEWVFNTEAHPLRVV